MKKYFIIALSIIFLGVAVNAYAILIGMTSPNDYSEWIPVMPSAANLAPGMLGTITSFTKTTQSSAFIFQASRTCNVQNFMFDVTSPGTGGTVDVSMQTVSTSTGDPTGATYGSSATSSDVVVGVSNTAYIATLQATTTVTQGTIFAMVITATSTGAVPNFAITGWTAATYSGGGSFPYINNQTNATGTWTRLALNVVEDVAVGCDDGTWMHLNGVIPQQGLAPAALTFASSTEEGLKFSNPTPKLMCGFSYYGSVLMTAAANINLWDNKNNLVYQVASSSLLGAQGASNGFLSAAIQNLKYTISTRIPILANQPYYLSAQPTGATAIGLYPLDMPASTTAMLETMDGGTAYDFVSRTSTVNGWTEVPYRRPLISINYCGDNSTPTVGYTWAQ